MSELVYELNPRKAEGPELFPRRDLLESLAPQVLDDFIEECFHKQRELEELIKLAIEVKESQFNRESAGEVAA